jgi:hypothetical protein
MPQGYNGYNFLRASDLQILVVNCPKLEELGMTVVEAEEASLFVSSI